MIEWWGWILVIIACILFYFLVLIRIVRKIWHFPIPAFATSIIDNPMRRLLIQNPEKIADRMDLAPGMIILEIGPGKGNYTLAVARRLLPDGKHYAIDIQQAILDKLQKRLDSENVTNVIPRLDDAYHLSFPDGTIDRILSIACLPEIPRPVEVLKEFKRVLKPDGVICLCELFIDPDYPLRCTEEKWAKDAGLVLKEAHGNWFAYQLHFGKA